MTLRRLPLVYRNLIRCMDRDNPLGRLDKCEVCETPLVDGACPTCKAMAKELDSDNFADAGGES